MNLCYLKFTLLFLGRGCPLLRHINLSSCENIDDIGISALGRNCPSPIADKPISVMLPQSEISIMLSRGQPHARADIDRKSVV